jgi:hypothetical protein
MTRSCYPHPMNRRRLVLALLSLATCYQLPAADEASFDDASLGKLKLGQEAAKVIQLLGKPESQGKDTEWGATGEWVQEWLFKAQGLRLNMASGKKGGPKTVLSIIATPPCKLATAAGIRLGSSESEVKKAYASVQEKEHSRPGETFVAGSIYGGIIFDFTAGKVSQIFIGASAE